MNIPKVGFIGFGEAAYNLAKGLAGEGIASITAYDKFWNVEPQATIIQRRAREAGVVLAESLSEMIREADYIFSAVSANLALPLAREAQGYLKEGQYYVDINAASPMTKEEVSEVILNSGAYFVDGAVMGPVPVYGHKVPISACGNGARAFIETFAKYGMDISYMGEKPGSSSASKMFRSIFMKGFVTLLLESIVASHKYGVEDDVLASIQKTLEDGSSILEVINNLLTRGVIHSARREHEMEEVIATLKSLNVDYTMSNATKEKLRWCTSLGFKEYFKGIPPQDYHEILLAYDKLNEENTGV
ncbi:MAG: 6-phosphogluconate dehydrogenase [Peptococcaceae bacterium]|jgi:3-hydroxyisobutyrate dehydrogenase-like beta-hydroxyacid dehydrogenase|nr:6-phosphogluconate dehydrogenase [Peptococcaceae bacterium]